MNDTINLKNMLAQQIMDLASSCLTDGQLDRSALLKQLSSVTDTPVEVLDAMQAEARATCDLLSAAAASEDPMLYLTRRMTKQYSDLEKVGQTLFVMNRAAPELCGCELSPEARKSLCAENPEQLEQRLTTLLRPKAESAAALTAECLQRDMYAPDEIPACSGEDYAVLAGAAVYLILAQEDEEPEDCLALDLAAGLSGCMLFASQFLSDKQPSEHDIAVEQGEKLFIATALLFAIVLFWTIFKLLAATLGKLAEQELLAAAVHMCAGVFGLATVGTVAIALIWSGIQLYGAVQGMLEKKAEKSCVSAREMIRAIETSAAALQPQAAIEAPEPAVTEQNRHAHRQAERN